MFGMTKGNKKVQGIELINEVAGRFSDMVNELDQGINDCAGEQQDIQTKIESLNERHIMLDSSVVRAKAIAANLRTILGE